MKLSPFLSHLSFELEKVLGQPVIINDISAEFGGSINESFALHTNLGKFFLKRNEAEKFPLMFEREAEGLTLLKNSSSFKIPEVLVCGSFKEYSFLVMEYVEKDNSKQSFWQLFGKSLAEQHKNTSEKFGLDNDNYIGSIRQSNSPKDSWADFFVSERLVPLVSVAHEKGKFELETVKQFEKLCFKIPDLFPVEPPALLHGDLWSGNYLCTKEGIPCVFDPAVYYGHREMDLAMMQLFGGFHTDAFKAYNEIYPLEPNWKQRINLCNLYPLLVHVTLFGGNYTREVKAILAQYS